MKRKLSQIGGAVLGYIHGNARGAYMGYKFGGKAYDWTNKRQKVSQTASNMPPVRSRSRGRTNQRSSSTLRSGTKSMSVDAKRSRMRSRSIVRGVQRMPNPGSLKTKGVRKGKAVKKEGRKKPVKVGKEFRKKVKAVLTSRGPIGKHREIVLQSIVKPVDNKQVQAIISPRSFDGVAGWQFSPTYIAYCYSLLYNKGAYPASPYDNINHDAILGYEPNMEIHVKEQFYVVRMKNNSARTYTIKLWDISPKSVQQLSYNTLQYMEAELTRTAPSGAPGTNNQEGRENPQNVSRTTIGFKPTMITSFNKNFALDETIITLEPGKEYTHKVMGPKDKIYKYNGYYVNGIYRNGQKFVKQTIINLYTDLVGTSLGLNGRFTDIVSADPFGVICETTHYTTIKCPDQTGFQNPNPVVFGTVQNLTQVGYCYAIKNWGDIEQSGTVIDVEDENPQAPATQGV